MFIIIVTQIYVMNEKYIILVHNTQYSLCVQLRLSKF